ncbi:phage head spike fiber domain-containing protein [Cupriavidus necator]
MTQRAFSDFIGFSRASAAWRFNSSGVLVQEAANVQRDDYDPVSGLWNGLLIEEARTNSIRNSSMVGVALGSPGTLPTGWWGENIGGLTRTIVATGTEYGLPYIDVRVSGTTSTTYHNFHFGAVTDTTAVSGQTWTFSLFAKLIAGSLANISTLGIVLGERDGASAYLTSGSANTPLTSALTRYTNTRTLANASTAYVEPWFVLNFASGVSIDATFRLSAPQLEQGGFATSPILTTNAQVTRAADVPAVGTLPPWFNPSEGTLYAEFVSLSTTAAIGMSLHDGTSQQAINIGRGGSGLPSLFVTTAGTTNVSLSQGAPITASLPSVRRLAAAYKAGDYALSVDGAAPATSSYAGALPTVSALAIGRNYTGSLALNGWLRALKYAPRRMTNAELQSMTTLPNANGPTLAFDFKAQSYNLEHI